MARRLCCGQVATEHAILLGLVTAALLGMQVYAKRGLQSGLKAAADQLSPFGRSADPKGELAQRAGMAYESGERRNRAIVQSGDVVARETGVTTETTFEQKITAREVSPGRVVTTTVTTEAARTMGDAGRGSGVSQYSEVVVNTSSR